MQTKHPMRFFPLITDCILVQKVDYLTTCNIRYFQDIKLQKYFQLAKTTPTCSFLSSFIDTLLPPNA